MSKTVLVFLSKCMLGSVFSIFSKVSFVLFHYQNAGIGIGKGIGLSGILLGHWDCYISVEIISSFWVPNKHEFNKEKLLTF